MNVVFGLGALAFGVLIGMAIQTRLDVVRLRELERRRNPPLRGGLR